MSIPSKIRLIQTLSGLTQEQLARELGVTFATLNSWINGRSLPRQKALARIEAYLGGLVGTEAVQGDSLTIKKALIQKNVLVVENILEMILSRKDMLDQFILSLTYNTNSIEGSTLTEAETAAVLFDDAALSNRTLTEQMEAKNHRAALLWLMDALKNDPALSETMVLKLHAMLMNGIWDDAGCYRRHSVRIVGANVRTANYLKIPEMMRDLVKEMNKKSKGDVITLTAEIHARFEQIHPFADGNGRIGRLLIQAMLLRANIAPAIIQKKKKIFYLRHLNDAQVKGVLGGLDEFLCDAVLQGYGVINKS